MAEVVIFGVEKMAELAYFYLSRDSDHEIAAFTVDGGYKDRDEMLGLPVVAFEEAVSKYPPDKYKMFVAIGYKKLNSLREQKYGEAKEKGYELISYLSSKATHWGDTEIGDNCFILENQVIQPEVKIGDNVVIWSGNHFGHNVTIADHCWLSTHIICSGGVSVGRNSFIGVNVTIRDRVKIGERCIIGAGAIILNDAADEEVYVASQTELYRLDSTYFERMMDISE